MKRLLPLLLLIIIALSAIPAHAQVPTIVTYFCVGATYLQDDTFNCYVSMQGYLIYAMEEVIGYCSNNNVPDVAEDVWAACADYQPTASATGFVNWGNSQIIGFPGRVISTASAFNMPGNPEETSTIDCYGVPGVGHEPIFSC